MTEYDKQITREYTASALRHLIDAYSCISAAEGEVEQDYYVSLKEDMNKLIKLVSGEVAHWTKEMEATNA